MAPKGAGGSWGPRQHFLGRGSSTIHTLQHLLLLPECCRRLLLLLELLLLCVCTTTPCLSPGPLACVFELQQHALGCALGGQQLLHLLR